MSAFLWAIHNALLSKNPSRFILFLPLYDDCNYKYLLEHHHVSILFTFPENTFPFDSPDATLGYKKSNHYANFKLNLILVENEAAFQKFPIKPSFQNDFSTWCFNHCNDIPSSTVHLKTKLKKATVHIPIVETRLFSKNISVHENLPDLNTHHVIIANRLYKYLRQLTSITSMGGYVPVRLWTTIKSLQNDTIPTNPLHITQKRVTETARLLRPLCWSPLDRNNGSMFSCCPQFYFYAL